MRRMQNIPDKEIYRIRKMAMHEIGHFDNRAWLALARLLGLHFPFGDLDKIDFLVEVKKNFILGGANEDTKL